MRLPAIEMLATQLVEMVLGGQIVENMDLHQQRLPAVEMLAGRLVETVLGGQGICQE